MGIRECPVCGLDQNADDTAFQHHINGHFDAGPSAPSSPPLRAAGVSSPKKRRLSVMKAEDDESDLLGEESCPLCSFPFDGASAAEKEQHVNACMDTTTTTKHNTESAIPYITHAPSRAYSTSSSSSHLQITTHTIPSSSRKPSQSNEDDHSPTYLLSDQLIQQSIAAGRDDVDLADEWDGPAKPGGYAEWVRTKRKGGVEKGDKWWDPRDGRMEDVPENFTPGLVPVLTQLLETSVHKGITKRAVLGWETLSITGVFRFDSMWGCGYRNALMSISSLLLHSPQLAKLFTRESNGADPGVRRLQGWLDEAWAKGFDPEGKVHFGGKVLGGGRWIGTGDLYALFSYKGVPCDLYDFPKPKTVDARPAHKALTEWVKEYFDEGLSTSSSSTIAVPNGTGPATGASNAFDVLMRDNEGSRGSAIRRADRYPLILQHNGHSRTVVGYEETSRGDMNLLMFDPGKSVPSNLREAGLRHTATHRTSNPTPTIPRKASHESHPFSPPYTNGASELTKTCDTPLWGRSSPTKPPRRLDGGAVDLEEDEEIDERGWVKKRINKLAKSVGSREGDGASGKKAKVDGVGGLGDGKGVAYFRVNLSTLGRHAEYQILAFTGDIPLTLLEQGRRRYLTSTVIT